MLELGKEIHNIFTKRDNARLHINHLISEQNLSFILQIY